MTQNNNMNIKFNFFIICIFLLTGILSCIFPYPFFSSNVLVNKNNQSTINDFYETENYNQFVKDFKVLNLDWFDAIDQIFERYKTIKVIDVDTLKYYYVQRGGGYNHADVEPIDSQNTQVFKSLYGNYSWTRRAVWVEIDGKYYAGSINGMPHGFSLIANNNLDGHTCIHFLNSKTHGTKKVDPDHQKCVQKAYDNSQKLANFLLGKKQI